MRSPRSCDEHGGPRARDGDVMPQIAGRADGSAVSRSSAKSSPEPRRGTEERRDGAYTGRMQEVLDVPNEVAAELEASATACWARFATGSAARSIFAATG